MKEYVETTGNHSPSFIDLTGKQFGALTVISRAPNQGHNTMWNCICRCGKEVVARSNHLRAGRIISCGCLSHENASKNYTTHGKKPLRLYQVWAGMKRRCNNTHEKCYPRYGGRGIKVCEEWSKSYEAFRDWALEHGYDVNAPKGQCTLDRIDNDGDYEPSNCRWVDTKAQANNRRRPSSVKHLCHAVEMLDTNGNPLRRFESIKSAAEATGCPRNLISATCLGHQKTTRGIKWRYAEDTGAWMAVDQ